MQREVEVLPIHKEVLEVFFSERGYRADAWAGRCVVEFNGTITEPALEGERVVVARWSIDLLGRISVRLAETTQLESGLALAELAAG